MLGKNFLKNELKNRLVVESMTSSKKILTFLKTLIIAIALLFFWSCGEKENVEYRKIPYEGNENEKEEPNIKAAFAIVKANCTSCHATQAPQITNQGDLITHKAKICGVIAARSMPPGSPLPDSEYNVIAKSIQC
jgi:hypothetical protein